MQRKTALALSIGLLSLASAGASAQQIEEILVTAQKRSENLQEVPISISAVTAGVVESFGIKSSADLSLAVPGLSISSQATSVLFYLRGVGTGAAQAGNEPAIATFVDGVYQPSMQGTTFIMNNIERIEVLKGPQGTLYGRNATGGAVSVITRTPSHDCAVEAEVGYGNYQTLEGKFYGTTGLSEKVAGDLAVYYRNMGKGQGENLVTGKDVLDRRDVALRTKLLIEPSDATTITLGADWAKEDSTFGMAYRPLDSSIAFLTGLRGWNGDHHDVESTVNPDMYNKSWGGSVKLEHDTGPVTLMSLTALRHVDSMQRGDVDARAIDIFNYYSVDHNRQWTQELQMTSNGDGRLKWVVGAFFLDAKTNYDPFMLKGLLFAPLDAFVNVATQETKSIAAFGQGTYELTDKTSLTLGARYTRDKRNLNFHEYGIIGGGTFPITPETQRDAEVFKKPTWRVALDHQLTEDVMVYASVSRGFKSGVFNLTAPRDPAVEPEILDAYEIGTKTALFDDRVRLNAATFYYTYDEMQLSKIVGASQQLLNAAKAQIYGLELDMEAVVSDQLTVYAGTSVLKAEYDEFDGIPISTPNPNAPFGNIIVGETAPGVPTDGHGYKLVNTPKFTGNLALDYHVPLADGTFAATVAYLHRGKSSFEPDGRLEQEATDIVNTQLKWTAPGDNWYLTLWSKNLTDEKYYLQQTEVFLGDLGSAAPARTFGVSVGVSL